MKTKEEKQKKFVTEFEINGEKYGGEIWATSWEEAEDFVKQRKATEKVEGGPCWLKEDVYLPEKRKEEIYSLIMEMGSLLTDYNHQWSNKLRKKFEKVVSFLNKL